MKLFDEMLGFIKYNITFAIVNPTLQNEGTTQKLFIYKTL